MGILNYLNKNYTYLKNDIENFNETLFSSPHSAIIKGRIITEKLLKEVSKLENYMFTSEISQYEKLKRFWSDGVLNIEAYTLFDKIRRIGNRAAHNNVEGELEAALNIHKNIYKLVGWFIEVYLDHNFELPPYKGPVPPGNKVENIDKDMIAGLLKKMLQEEVPSTEIMPENKERNIKCLVQELSKLRKSSKEAVEGLAEFTDFKKYMHIEREAQIKLHNLIENANKSKNAQLILVSGSVGDGKSHIISYFKNNYPDLINNFTLHNDATESLEPNKTSTDTLNEVLDDFSDGKIKMSNRKMILAINLGTLNNFIDSKYGKRFSLFKEYVQDKKIIETSVKCNGYEDDSFFQFINFSDYHIFTLKDGKVSSDYIKSLISKVTSSSQLNPFYSSYKKHCDKCGSNDFCPIKYNYEFLNKDGVQEAIIDLLVQCVIRNKIIISTRSLMNFIYELIVPRTHINMNSPTLKNDISTIGNINYIKALMPNIIFNHKELSFIFEALHGLDPLDVRNKEVDDFIIEFKSSTNVLAYFKEYLDFPEGYMNKIYIMNIYENEEKTMRYELLKLFIRSYYICGKENIFSLKDCAYEDYMTNIYLWNNGDKNKLKELYENVKNGILKWNGDADKDQINIFIGKNQIKYKISEDIELKADLTNLPQKSEKDFKVFTTTLNLQYKGTKSKKSDVINIDFALYQLLMRINGGYRPNKKDKNQFINFTEFINKLEETGSQNEKLVFTEKNRENNKKFKLEYDSEFEFYRFMETSI